MHRATASGDPSIVALLDLAAPAAHEVCLDYGAGVGHATFAVSPLVRKVLAIDPDEELLREAERLARELGLTNVEYRAADLLLLPLADGEVDLALCGNVLQRLREPVPALRELRRVVRPGGRAVVLEAVVDEATDRYLNELARLRDPRHWRHYREEEYEALFARAGWEVVQRRRLQRSVDLDAWAEAGIGSSQSAGLVRSRIREYPTAVQLALDVAYADRHISFSYDVLAARLQHAS